MANLTPTPGWDAVPQLEMTTPVLGGPGGPANAQAQALVNRFEAMRGAGENHGASLVGVHDAGGYFTGANGEDILQELGRSRKLLEVYADVLTDGTNQTAELQAYITLMESLKVPMRLPPGNITFNDTLIFDGYMNVIGAGRDRTTLIFDNSTSGKPAFQIKRNSSKGRMQAFTLCDDAWGTSTGIEITDSLTTPGTPAWKNTFYELELVGLDVSHKYTSSVPLTGSGHAQASENVWHHCRFVINRTLCLNQNSQAYNNTYYSCDGENFDTTYRGTAVVDSWDMFTDEAGGGIVVIGGSWIGRGKLFRWKYPTGGTGLFSGGSFVMEDTRIEARTTHGGVLFYEDVHGVTGSLAMSISVKNMEVLAFGASIDLMRYAGRVNARFENVYPTAGNGVLTVRQYPTTGRTSNTTTASQGTVDIVDSAVYREKETTSYVGVYAANSTGRMTSRGARSGSTGSSMAADAQGFFGMSGPGDAQQLGMQLNNIPAPGRLVWNNDSVTSGVASDVKVLLPKGARPLKLIAYKHPQQFAANVGVLLYLVKDNANWVNPAAFAKATDALLVASMPSTAGAAGYYEVPVLLVANSLGNELRAGFGSWTEGRMYFEHVGGATSFPGWFGVEYL